MPEEPKIEREKQRKDVDIDLVKITERIIKGDPKSKEELKKHIKMLKADIQQKECESTLSKNISINPTLAVQVNDLIKRLKAFSNIEPQTIDALVNQFNSSLITLEKDIEKGVNEITQEFIVETPKLIKNQLDIVKTIILNLKNASTKAIEEQSYDKAIAILNDTKMNILPLIGNTQDIPEQEKIDLKRSILNELGNALIEKGMIDDAICVLDETIKTLEPQIIVSKKEINSYLEVQVKKSLLLVQSGDFSRAIEILSSLHDNCCADEGNPSILGEIQRGLGMAYRGMGSYDLALKHFLAAQDHFTQNNDFEGFNSALWGQGILHYLRGEWNEAQEIWRKLKDFYEKRSPKMLYKLYFEYTRTLQLSGDFTTAEEMLKKAENILNDNSISLHHSSRAYIFLAFAELFLIQNRVSEALNAIESVRSYYQNADTETLKKLPNELKILDIETEILCKQEKTILAREKLVKAFSTCKSNWDYAKYFRILSRIEKHEMNYGEAIKALESSIDKIKEIGATTYSDQLLLIELLIDMARIGNQKAYSKAVNLLQKIESEITNKNLPVIDLECKLMKGLLTWSQNESEKAFSIFTQVVDSAEQLKLYRLKSKAIESMNAIEHQDQQLSSSTREKSVFRYLDDARRILGEYS